MSPTSSLQRHESHIAATEALEVHVAEPLTVPNVFPGGPSDSSLCYLYPDHATKHMWDGEVT